MSSRVILEPVVVERHEPVLLNEDAAREVMGVVDETLEEERVTAARDG